MAMHEDDIAERLAAARERLVLEHLEARPSRLGDETAPGGETTSGEGATIGERLLGWLRPRSRREAATGRMLREDVSGDASGSLPQRR